jgi:hypothetical protein
MQTSTGIIDYYLKFWIEGGFSKITSSGSTPRSKHNQMNGFSLSLGGKLWW